MNTLYVRCQTKDYILDIVADRAGMRINKVNSVGFLTIGESRGLPLPSGPHVGHPALDSISLHLFALFQ